MYIFRSQRNITFQFQSIFSSRAQCLFHLVLIVSSYALNGYVNHCWRFDSHTMVFMMTVCIPSQVTTAVQLMPTTKQELLRFCNKNIRVFSRVFHQSTTKLSRFARYQWSLNEDILTYTALLYLLSVCIIHFSSIFLKTMEDIHSQRQWNYFHSRSLC